MFAAWDGLVVFLRGFTFVAGSLQYTPDCKSLNLLWPSSESRGLASRELLGLRVSQHSEILVGKQLRPKHIYLLGLSLHLLAVVGHCCIGNPPFFP